MAAGLFRRFVSDLEGNARVGVTVIVLLCMTAIAWYVTAAPVAMMLDILVTVTDHTRALSIINSLHFFLGLILLAEVVALLIWLFASAFKREDQTYYGGMFEE